MLDRCRRPTSTVFKDYGGRGIAVCERWREAFQNFLDDMGPCPDGLELDRTDNNGHYAPENCRWTTRQKQCNNKRNNIRVTVHGVQMTAREAAASLRIPEWTFRRRLRKGWTVDQIIARHGQSSRSHRQPST
jgi:hypothetical protein